MVPVPVEGVETRRGLQMGAIVVGKVRNRSVLRVILYVEGATYQQGATNHNESLLCSPASPPRRFEYSALTHYVMREQ